MNEVIEERVIKFTPHKVFEFNDKKYLYTTNNSGVYEVDENIVDILKQDGNDVKSIYEELSKNIDTEAVDSILSNMETLNLIRNQQNENITKSLNDEDCDMVGITLMLCQDCNMRCSYCYAGDGEYSNKGYMDFDTAKKGIDFLVENSSKDNVSVCLFGGEPLLNFKLFKEIVEYCKSIEDEVNKKFSFTTTINGTLLNENIEKYLVDNKISVQISIDGDEKTQNANRYFENKISSYDRVVKKTKSMREKGLLAARATITKENLNMIEVFDHLYDLNFRSIPFAPAHNLLTKDDYIDIEKSYIDLINYYEELIKDGSYKKANTMTIIKSFISKIHNGGKRSIPCGVGQNTCAVDINGDIYPCHRFVSDTEHKIGNLNDGFKNRLDLINKFVIDEKVECLDCWAKNLCIGGCPNESVNNTENAQEICHVTKIIFENLMRVYVNLTEDEKKYIF